MKNTGPKNNHKKEPQPDQEQTVSSNPNISRQDYYARRGTMEWRKEQIRSLHERLTDPQYHLRQTGTLYTKKWRELLVNGTCYQLLGVLMRTCNWRDRRWHGNIFTLAAVMGVSERTVRYQLNKLKKISGFEVYRHPWSITVFLPERIFPKGADREEQTHEQE